MLTNLKKAREILNEEIGRLEQATGGHREADVHSNELMRDHLPAVRDDNPLTPKKTEETPSED